MESFESGREQLSTPDLAQEIQHLLDAEQSLPNSGLSDWRQQVLNTCNAIDTQREIGMLADDDKRLLTAALEQFLSHSRDDLAKNPVTYSLEQLREHS